jgi:hypothetical protein
MWVRGRRVFGRAACQRDEGGAQNHSPEDAASHEALLRAKIGSQSENISSEAVVFIPILAFGNANQ